MSRWTTDDFEQLSWHDNHIHGLAIRDTGQALGELAIDIDFILEWLCDRSTGSCDFRIAPATLTFHEVADLVLSLDYATPTAALCPASIHEIERTIHTYPNGAHDFAWSININWPAGFIRFKASGFTQALRGPAIVVPGRQYLNPDERAPL